MAIALYCDNTQSGEKVKKQIALLCDTPVCLFTNRMEFITAVKSRPDLVMLIMQKGATSTETAMSAREHNPKGKLIWFCDLDFALLSFRLKAAYFGLLPVADDKLKTALSYCEINIKDESSGEGA